MDLGKESIDISSRVPFSCQSGTRFLARVLLKQESICLRGTYCATIVDTLRSRHAYTSDSLRIEDFEAIHELLQHQLVKIELHLEETVGNGSSISPS